MCFCPDVNTNHRCTAFYNKILALGIILSDGFWSLKPGSFKITGYQMTCDYYGMYTLLLKMLIDIWRYKIHLKNNLKVSCVMFLTRRQLTLSVRLEAPDTSRSAYSNWSTPEHTWSQLLIKRIRWAHCSLRPLGAAGISCTEGIHHTGYGCFAWKRSQKWFGRI